MSESYRRCRYVSESNIECGVFFAASEVSALTELKDKREYLCILHRDVISTTLASQDIGKDTYIARRNAEAKLCADMTFAELDAHIAGIELVIEAEKLKVLTAKAVKSQKLENLTEEERAERRKIKTPRSISDVPRKSKSTSEPKVTLTNNPLKYMMQKNGLTRENAIMMLGMTEEEALQYD